MSFFSLVFLELLVFLFLVLVFSSIVMEVILFFSFLVVWFWVGDVIVFIFWFFGVLSFSLGEVNIWKFFRIVFGILGRVTGLVVFFSRFFVRVLVLGVMGVVVTGGRWRW